MEYEKVIDLIREVKACGVGEFELQQGDFRIAVKMGRRQHPRQYRQLRRKPHKRKKHRYRSRTGPLYGLHL